MKHILIIEDNKLKEARMRNVLDSMTDFQFEYLVCPSIKVAYPALDRKDKHWNLVLLDMSFQVNQDLGKETKKKPLAGREVLQFMRAGQLKSPVIVVTQHSSFVDGATVINSVDELDKKFGKYFPEIYRSTISIDLAVDSWHAVLISEVRKALNDA